MARWLAIAVDHNGAVKAALVNDPAGTNLPHGDHERIIRSMGDVDELTALVELPDGDFRPEVIDTAEDSEAPVSFVDFD